MNQRQVYGIAVLALLSSCDPGAEPAPAVAGERTARSGQVEAFGIVKTGRILDLHVEFNASVVDVRVRDGDRVVQGQDLVVLDLDQSEEEIERRRHELRLAEIGLAGLERGPAGEGRSGVPAIDQLANRIANTELELAQLRRERERLAGSLAAEDTPEALRLANELETAPRFHEIAQQEMTSTEGLVERGSVSKAVHDAAVKEVVRCRQALQVARFALDGWRQETRLALEEAESTIVAKEGELANLRLDLEIATAESTTLLETQRERVSGLRAELDRLRSRLAKGSIAGDRLVCGPAAAIVFDVSCRSGDRLSPERRILSLMDLAELRVLADVSEDFIKDVRIGAPATIVPVADPSRSYAGRVLEISGMAVDKNGEYVIPVSISIDEPDLFLKPNFNVDVRIEMGPGEGPG